jgi:hypothetical protein
MDGTSRQANITGIGLRMIRLVGNCEIKQRVMGGTDNGIQPFEAVSLFSCDVCIANALNLSNFGDERTQVLLCETCGHVGCGSVGWVHLRKVGQDVVWIPPRKLFLQDQNFDWQEFPPPYFASDVFGIPVFREALYDELRVPLPWLPDRTLIQPIRACEALALLQGEAPFELLGHASGALQLRRDRVLAVSEGDRDEEMDAVDAFSRDHARCETPLRPVNVDASYKPIEFHLDAPGFPAWSGFCRFSTGIGIMLEPWRPLKLNSDDEPIPVTG